TARSGASKESLHRPRLASALNWKLQPSGPVAGKRLRKLLLVEAENPWAAPISLGRSPTGLINAKMKPNV
ncbi:MAG: hypothetical protein ACJA2P_002150, partial [Rhodoferax sp.]